MSIDHVLIAVADFREAAASLWSEHGLRAIEGGRHPDWGTANWIVPIGTSYLELVGVVDRPQAATTVFGRRALEVIEAGGGPYAWCLAVTDFDGAVARLGLSVSAGSRVRPDGETISWRTAGMSEGLVDPSRPFFIAWDIPSRLHPSRSAATHRVQAPKIAWIEVAGDEASVRSWIGDAGIPVRVRAGRPSILAIGIQSLDRESVIHGR